MYSISPETISARVDAIKAGLWRDTADGLRANTTQGATQSTFTILRAIYGEPSPQMAHLTDRLKRGHGQWDNESPMYDFRVATELESILDSAVADLAAGLAGSIRVQAKGEILGDFVALARTALSTTDVGSERVAAVLTAAALEETLKELGVSNGVDVYSRDYRGVVQKLKDAGVLTGAQPGLANGLSTFRDKAFHGQTDQIERGTIESALAFVEGLLASRFL